MSTLAAESRRLIAGFCTPLDDWDAELVEGWLVLRAARRARDLATELRRRERTDPGLADALDAGADRIRSIRDLWHPATGVLMKHRRYARRGETSAAELALHWHELGVAGRWQLGAESGTECRTLHFGGHRIEGGIASFESNGSEAIIEIRSGRILHFRFVEGAWTSPDVNFARLAICDHVGAEQWAMRAACDDQDGGIPPTRAYAQAIAGALARLAKDAPHHWRWCMRLIHSCLPLAGSGNTIRSWSSAEYPGLVALCASGTELEICETLIHEAAHQHFHALKHFGDVIAPGSREMAWSPVKRCDRPMEMVLLSYHAFANVQLFYRQLMRAGIVAADWYLSHCATLIEWRPILEAALQGSSTITPLGKLLYCQLSARLDEDF
jgi:HEXXH motif-containing protein